ncbi:hypothetical protein [Sphingorhabdus sp. EL138]|uniref:hypothetical protein n=1 Tax=Sphingorhabdus sp. EL138 TaxID=2073156 RepID=UPI000D689875|nr:hypothetical protein [Sphingorhabdus sp. EL138]
MTITLTVVALLLSALAPQGFMPKYSTDGFSIELCSGHANNKLAITPDHPDYAMLAMVYDGPEKPDTPNSETGNSVCTYAASSGAGLISAASAITLSDHVMAPHVPEAQRHFAVRNRINIPPATGPPVAV